MKPNPLHRLPAPLEAAVQRLKMAARDAAERSIESLGLAALASSNAFQRDGLLGAQFELNRKSAVFVLTFNDALDERILRELSPRQPGATNMAPLTDDHVAPPPAAAPTDWASLSLVEDKEVEAQISADRFGLEISHACEWELRELEGYVSALLGEAGGERDRNPLRPDLVGHAMIRGIEAVSDRPEIRKVLSGEFSRSLGGLLRETYADIVAGLRNAGVQPQGLTVRHRGLRSDGGAHEEDAPTTGGALGRHGEGHSSTRSGFSTGPGHGHSHRHASYGGPGFGSSTRTGARSFGHVDPAMMTLIRRLTHAEGAGGRGDGPSDYGHWSDDAAPPPPNLIRAHRDELRQAAKSAPDHLVIDLIGFMFDQILADPKVPPQMARQIARLQLPVLRAALGDASFFSSRRHPVRRFINRIASLGAAYEDFGEEGARAFLSKVKALVHEVVDGDFEQIDVYEQKLAALEAFTAELASRDGGDGGQAAALLGEKEDQARLRALYASRLSGELKDISAPAFLRDFVSRVWSQALLRAAEKSGPDGALTQRMRAAGRELFLSVQPKTTPAHRKAFLAELPKLMQDLTEGMNLVGWPEAERRAFFGQLMPAHAEALKSPFARPLDINMMARQLEGALAHPVPSREELKHAPLPAQAEMPAPQLSADEARRAGLLTEAAVDWNGKIDIDLGAEPEPAETDTALPGLPTSSEPPEPTEGRALAENVQIGFAYQMNLNGQWHKVRLSHVSPGRSFFIFTYGAKQRKTISLTQRMLVRLCETGRMKAYESAYLVERATARARQQLAALAAGA